MIPIKEARHNYLVTIYDELLANYVEKAADIEMDGDNGEFGGIGEGYEGLVLVGKLTYEADGLLNEMKLEEAFDLLEGPSDLDTDTREISFWDEDLDLSNQAQTNETVMNGIGYLMDTRAEKSGT